MVDSEEEEIFISKFKIGVPDLVEIVDSYTERTFDEDIKLLKNKFKGMDGLAMKLKTNLKTGIESDDLKERDFVFGNNRKLQNQRTSFYKLLLAALDDLMLKILIFAAIISLVVSMIFEKDNKKLAWLEGAAILVAVLVVAIVTAWNDYKKEEQFIKLNNYNNSRQEVLVEGFRERKLINIDEIKVGDLVQIEAGMTIPCDALLVRGGGVLVDESSLSGESKELKKENLEM